jgi:tripartite-type tricarboxylate transporter receptor subunit TctC
MSVRILSAAAVAALITVAGVPRVDAQQYPTKPIRMLVPVAAGGFTDTVSRLTGQVIADALGQQVVIDNRGGGAGIVASEATAKAEPDGYTLMMAIIGTHAVNVGLYGSKLSYDPVRDFVPVSLVATTPNLLLVHPSVQATSVKELVTLAKAKPGQIHYGSNSIGGSSHLAMELFKAMTGTDLAHIPYKGSAPMLTDLLSGQVSTTFDNIMFQLPQVRAGKLRALAISSSERSSLAPEIPTVAESGVPGFEVSAWYGVVAPAGTPRPIVDRLQAAIAAGMRKPEMVKRLEGSFVVASTAAEFERFMKAEIAKWTKVIREANIRVN